MILLVLALLAQDAAPAPAADGPVATQTPRKQDVAPLPIQGGKVSPPTDDYGYVAWCYGAVGGYVDLYDKAMPEVIRIERAWPTPGTEENIAVVYPQQKKDAIRSLGLYKRAIEAAEKASPTPIATQGAAAIKKGRGVWTGATTVPKAQLAQFWMSWAPPAKCDETAAALEKKATLFGQALTYNADVGAPAAAAPAPAPAAETPLAEAAPAAPPAEVAKAEVAEETPTPTADAPLVEEARAEVAEEAPAPDAPAAEPEPAAEASTGTAETPSAIDDLLPAAEGVETAKVAEPEPEPEAEPEPAAPPPVAKPEPAKPAAAAPAKPKPKPAAPKKKPGLRDTLKGMRGPA